MTAALNVRYGVAPEEAYKPNVHSALKCGRCATMNRPDASFCLRCGGPLSLDAVKQAQTEENELDRLTEMLLDPKVRAFLVRRLRGSRPITVQAPRAEPVPGVGTKEKHDRSEG